MSNTKEQIQFVFFGTNEFSVIALNELKQAGFISALVVTATDKPKGRGMRLTPPLVKVWAEKNNIPYIQPEKLDAFFLRQMSNVKCQMFIVASYGKILPKEILKIPQYGTLNIHPSLLPFFRGPSPIHSQILENTGMVGVSIMLMDEKVDHGPILAKQILELPIADCQFENLRDELAKLGGKLLAETIPEWVAGNIDAQEQDHSKATYTKKIKKEDGLIQPYKDDHEKMYRKFLAFSSWPGVFFFKNRKRIKVTNATFENKEFVIKKVIMEGKKEEDYSQILQHS